VHLASKRILTSSARNHPMPENAADVIAEGNGVTLAVGSSSLLICIAM
jgi:hypothetical protein